MMQTLDVLRNPSQPLSEIQGNYHIQFCCYKIDKPDPLKTVRRIILFDAFVLLLDAVLTIIYIGYAKDKNTLWLAAICEILVSILMVLSLRGLETSIKVRQLSQKLYCYNCLRVFYMIIIQISAIGSLLEASSAKNEGRNKAFLNTWGIIMIILTLAGLILQPALYSICRAFTNTQVAFPQTRMYFIQSGGQAMLISQGHPHHLSQPAFFSPVYGQPVYGQPVYGQVVQGSQPAAVPFQEISLNDPAAARQQQSPFEPSMSPLQASQVPPPTALPYRPTAAFRNPDSKS